MKIDGWKYYNRAAVPTVAPHEEANTEPIENGNIWKLGGRTPLLARWTTEFDCGYETNWWYVIKDTPFDINALKAKRRYEINKGVKNFEVIEINPSDYKDELYEVQVAAVSTYPEKYRSTVNRQNFLAAIDRWDKYIVFGAFSRASDELCGYALLSRENDNCIGFYVLKTAPQHEKNGVNAALVEGVLRCFQSFLTNGGYICDGARSINHKTAFQDYLEKYFGFRKAFCKLKIVYHPRWRWLVKTLYCFRKLLRKFDGVGIMHQLNSVLRMEEICRKEGSV